MGTINRWIPLVAIGLSLLLISTAEAASSTIVISQVYGGGGNSGSTLKNDFVELFNLGGSAVSVTGWTIQYAAATGTAWESIQLSGTIQPGRYYLIAAAAGLAAPSTYRLQTQSAALISVRRREKSHSLAVLRCSAAVAR